MGKSPELSDDDSTLRPPHSGLASLAEAETTGSMDPGSMDVASLAARVAQLTLENASLKADLRGVAARVGDIPCLIGAVGRDYRITFLNRAVQGISPRALVGRTATKFLTEASAERGRAAIDYVFRSGSSVDLELDTLPYQGEPGRRYRVRLGPGWRGSEVASAMVVALDVTEWSSALEDFEHLAFGGDRVPVPRRRAPAAFWTTDAELNLTSYRNSSAPAGSVPPEPSLGMLFASDDAHRRALAGETVVTAEQSASGEHRITLRPLRDADGTPVGVVGVAESTGARSARSEAIEQAQKMETLGRIAGGIVHDFNNLLTAMFGYAGLLERQYGDAPPRELRELQSTQSRATGLVRQLMQFARRRATDPSIVDVAETVLEMEHMLGCAFGEGVELTVTAQAGHAYCVGDRSEIEQVVMNLVINGRQAISSHGTVALSIDVLAGSEASRSGVGTDERFVVIAVADTGHGIDDAVRSAMFEPFFTTRGQLGTGLGLPTAAHVVERCGGWIDVDSAPGHGATFSVWLPAVTAPRVSELPQPDSPWPMGSESILVVDSDHWARESTAEVLRASGYRVTTARDGEHALEVIDNRTREFALVVAERFMPRLAGAALAGELQRRQLSTRVVLVSAHTTGEAGAEAGEDTWLQKPFTPRRLAAHVRSTLDD